MIMTAAEEHTAVYMYHTGFKTRPGIHSKQDKHSGRTHGSTPHGADERDARASRSQSYWWNTVGF